MARTEGTIRRFTYADLEQVVEIEKSAFSEPNDERFGLYDFHFYHRYYKRYFLIYQNPKTREILGYIIFTPRGHIVSVAVDPRYKGNGVGKRLLSQVFDISKKVWLEVEEHNKEAKNFYRYLGFREKKILPDYYTSREDAIVMELNSENLAGPQIAPVV